MRIGFRLEVSSSCGNDNGFAEGVGFEPTETCASTVFKTVPFVRSGIPPIVQRTARGRRQPRGFTSSNAVYGRSTSGTTNPPSLVW